MPSHIYRDGGNGTPPHECIQHAPSQHKAWQQLTLLVPDQPTTRTCTSLHATSKSHRWNLLNGFQRGRPKHIEMHENVHFEILVKQNHLQLQFLFLREIDWTNIGSTHLRQHQ